MADALLPYAPPRPYRLRDTYRGRVWRTPLQALATDGVIVAFAAALAGLAHDLVEITWLGGLGAVLLYLLGHLAHLTANLRRLRLIREAPWIEARLDRPRRVLLVHELFKGNRERTYALPYTYTLPDGRELHTSVWICGCVRDRFPAGSTERVIYDPQHPRRSMLLRLAVMRAPH